MNADDFRKQLDAAEGYTSLGMLEEAFNILEDLPQELKVTKEVITLHMGILVKSKKYLEASFLAETLSNSEPDNADRILMVARYRYMGGEINEAMTWLSKAAKKRSNDAYFHYLTAQCHASVGDLEKAKESLKTAFELNQELRLGALDDPVFEKLW